MRGLRLVAATTSVVFAVAPAADPTTPVRRPKFVPCPVASVPGAKPPPEPPATPVRDRSRPTVGGEGLGTTGLTLPAGAPALPSTLTGRSWVVADMNSGAVLGACGPHEYATPASVQKLLLALALLPKLDPTQVVEVTPEDLKFEPGSSAVGLLVGGKYTVETLWLGLLLNSGNDAANVLARVGGGDAGVAGTLAAMNAEARRLGALETKAVTPSGLDAPGQFTSAYDLALIARACFAREDFRRYAATQRAQVPAQPPKDPRGFQIQNDNQLLGQYPGALGGKTGFTDLARHTFVGAAERDGRRLVVTLLGAETRPVRATQQAAALLDWGFALPSDATVGRLVDAGETERKPTSNKPSAGSSPGGGAPTRAAGTMATVRSWMAHPAVLTALTIAAVGLPVMLILSARREAQRHRQRRNKHWV